MLYSLAIIVIFIGATAEAAVRIRRGSRLEGYCNRQQDHFNKHCFSSNNRVRTEQYAKFCPVFQKHCSFATNNVAPVRSKLGMVLPPHIPQTGELSHPNRPLSGSFSKAQVATIARLDVAIIASCNPDCTAVHCTVECKCAYSHPEVHSRCNPPSSSRFVRECQEWYSKCPMYQRVAYK